MRRRRSSRLEPDATAARIVADAADAILVISGTGTILHWNEAASRTFGYGAGEVLGRGYEILLPEGRSLEPEILESAATGEPIADLRVQRRRKDASILSFTLSRFPLRDPEGPDRLWAEILRDITSHRELERAVIQTEKMAAIGKIASKVVHEIRNPLGSINLNVDILLEAIGGRGASEDAEAREILHTIKRETKRLTQITEEYLQFSRMPQSRGREEDLNAVLLELADFLRPELRRSEIRLVLKLDDNRPLVACDSRLLRQVLLNLIRNAMDAVPVKSGQVTVVTSAARGGGEIEVADNGPGIADEHLPHIFEPFYTTKREGTGLGLAVVSQIVGEHGGEVSCRSAVGKGTVFRIWIPGGVRGRASWSGPSRGEA